jgi:hypothetical protein
MTSFRAVGGPSALPPFEIASRHLPTSALGTELTWKQAVAASSLFQMSADVAVFRDLAPGRVSGNAGRISTWPVRGQALVASFVVQMSADVGRCRQMSADVSRCRQMSADSIIDRGLAREPGRHKRGQGRCWTEAVTVSRVHVLPFVPGDPESASGWPRRPSGEKVRWRSNLKRSREDTPFVRSSTTERAGVSGAW